MTDLSPPQVGDLLQRRYKILEHLNPEDTMPRYRAQDQDTLQTLILIAFPFAETIQPRKVQALENELDDLLKLNSPAIAHYYSYFRQEVQRRTTLYLVQQEIIGSTLMDLIAKGWKPSEKTVRKIAEELCGTFIYLHNLDPPLVHQAINPSNILRQDNGSFILTNFGMIRNAYLRALDQFPDPIPTGYEAPEQLDYHKNVAHDLYSLGLTLVFLLTGKHPHELPTHHQKIWFRQSVDLSKPFRDWLEHLIEPAIAHRFTLAEEALSALFPENSEPNQRAPKAPFSPIIVQKKGSGWFIGLSPLWIGCGGTHLLLGIVLLIALQPMFLWVFNCIQASTFLSQITFANTPCTSPYTRKELKDDLFWQVSGTASRADIALVLVKIGKRLVPEDYACAEGSFREAIRLHPNLAVAHNNLGVVKYQQKEYKDAIASFQEALRLNPGYGEANSNLGRALEDSGHSQEAMTVFGKVQPKNLQPTHRILSLVLGVPTTSASGREQIPSSGEGVMQYRRALQRYPSSPDIHYNLGVALDTQGELEAAIAEYQATIQLKPNFAEAHGNLANAYAIQGKRIEAYSHFQTAIALFRTKNRTYDVQKVQELMRHFQFL
jgi:serine/threonine protein kinase/Flp pilus assembly protein TadD